MSQMAAVSMGEETGRWSGAWVNPEYYIKGAVLVVVTVARSWKVLDLK